MAFFERCPVRWGAYPPERVREGLAWRGKAGWVELAWWTGGQGGGARGGGVQGLRFRGVGGRDTGSRDGANFATHVVFFVFLKDALWGGGGGYPRALVAGEGRDDGSSKQRGGKGSGKGWLGGRRGCKGFGCGHGPQGRSKFRNVCQKEEKWLFLKDALWGGGGGTHRSWPGGRGGRPRAWLQERVGGA